MAAGRGGRHRPLSSPRLYPGWTPRRTSSPGTARIQAGEPYSSADPALANALHQITTWKSPYYQAALMAADTASGQQVPVFDVQGWTDELFPEAEAISLVNELRAIDQG